MVQPLRCRVEYRLSSESDEVAHIASFDISGVEPVRTAVDVSLLIEFTPETFIARVVPLRELTVLSCEFEFERAFSRDERVLLNGWQSWTDTAEVSPWARFRGLNGLPVRTVDYFSLDGSGDYRFMDYSFQAGALHGWTYAYCRGPEHIELVGSLDESSGFTLLRMDTPQSRLFAQKEVPQHAVGPGQPWTALNLAFLASDEGSDAALDGLFERWFALMGVTRRPATPLVGYSSWYRHYGDIDEPRLLADLQSCRAGLGRLDTRGFTPVFQVDDGWAKVGDWAGFDDGRFPSGMRAMAERIADAGFVPGLWMAPFVAELDSALIAEHPEWLLLDEWGTWTSTGSHWSGGFALDTRNAQVRAYVRDCIRMVTRSWGFKMLKLDFLYAACMVPHDSMNRGELMADAIALIREAAGDDVAIDACGVPLASVFGQVEYCRVGCDVGLDWDGMPHMRLTERERVSTRNNLANTVYRAPLNGRAFLADPDVVLLRDDVDLTDDQRQMLLDADACFGGMLLTSDDVGMWTPAQFEAFQGAIDLMRQARS